MAVTLQVDLFYKMLCQQTREHYSRKVSAFESACTLDWTPFWYLSCTVLQVCLMNIAGCCMC